MIDASCRLFGKRKTLSPFKGTYWYTSQSFIYFFYWGQIKKIPRSTISSRDFPFCTY
ncbi:hypothetical protein P872_16200 [Rhodonellum psychrophilum GCM71 = DSM 17998]|uniref:Uncharacterized protein n=1 Tax=Rhodonellum psychrophilum GCM71 = DSM 17998 TaxID=1123057 RepID=U5BS33_9BACT|nr:hypothetical protein P872_16200 [Rhodonellum psychrophilum GCM71 = DSM 17998]